MRAATSVVESGALAATRLESWHRLAHELAVLEARHDPLLAAARRARDRSLHRLARARIRDKGR